MSSYKSSGNKAIRVFMGQKNENGHIHDVFYTHIIDVVSQIVVSPKISDKKNTFSVRRGDRRSEGGKKSKLFGMLSLAPTM